MPCATSPSLAEPVVTKQSLPVFMLQATPQQGDVESRIDLNTSRGTALRIEESPSEATEPLVPQTRAHVIDARGIEDPLRSIHFEWRSPDEASEVRVRIEASDDLDVWHTVVHASTLLQVEQGQQRLRRESIPLPQQQYRYLRVARADGGPPLLITSVVGERVSEPEPIDPVWFTAELQASNEDEWLFDAGRLAPVTYAKLSLPHDNVSVRVRIESRTDADDQWRARWSGESYAVLAEGQRRVSAPAQFSATHDRYWRVVPASASTLATAPTLELGYRPARLQLLAQGNGPYTLAFGSRRAQSAPARACGTLIADVRGDELARLVALGQLGTQRTLGGDAALQPLPRPTSFKRIVLWTVLVGGVALLIAMALSLLRRVRPTQ